MDMTMPSVEESTIITEFNIPKSMREREVKEVYSVLTMHALNKPIVKPELPYKEISIGFILKVAASENNSIPPVKQDTKI